MSSSPSSCRQTPPLISMKSVKIEDFQDDPESLKAFQKISSRLTAGKRIIVITGAGISVSSGIPDFRSAGGLYERLGLKFGNGNQDKLGIKGKDFFDAGFFHAEKTRPLFCKFIAELKEMCEDAKPTPTHAFLKRLIDEKRVIRWYTQNIDGLEERVGLGTTVSEPSITPNLSSVPVVGLHGTLGKLSCTVCKSIYEYKSEEHGPILKSGQSPDCSACQERSAARQERGQRKLKSGILRPDIVLYNEPHPQGDLIAELLSADLARRPTMLLVIGTSLKVVGLKRMIKDVARAIRRDNPEGEGLCVYLNKTEVQGRSEWRSVFDYELVGECDAWVSHFLGTNTSEASQVPPIVKAVPAKKPAVVPSKKLDSFYKHVKKATGERPAKKVLASNEEKENAVLIVNGPMTRSRSRRQLTAIP